ncbi:porin family protein [Winogradskyella flava]|uniref:PorT family protein n=1 Tax=Winogradskyella flava TaxID=1884876 RepID=A0A842IN10_9FLAO|nr:porin family protein [Winogradskyella flava]MBC2843609.1 PorT family protein [Winogradskyella flava]
MKIFLLGLITLVGSTCYSQNEDRDKSELYKKYREDQFYISVTYNLLNNKPEDVNQNGFSSGFHFGFIRDMPINERRNKAFGLGLGLSTNSYNQNVSILETNGDFVYEVINGSEINVSKNKFTTYLVEVPLEYRWRTSTATDYNFWRIYSGFKFGYLFYNSSKFKSDIGNERLSNIDAFNKLQYGLTLSVGYGTWNFHMYYGLNPIFDDSAKLEGNSIDLSSFKIGLIFYIL